MKTQQERNREYYQANREELKRQKLAYYYENKDKIDREKKKEYMRDYLKTHKRKPITPEKREEINRKRRERYATDTEYREREKAKAKERNQRNPAAKRNSRLKAEFGISLEQYNDILDKQGGSCAICGATSSRSQEKGKRRKSMYIDHDHNTGAVRGLLCHHCNFGIGHFFDNPALLQTAAEYLIKWSFGVT